MRVTASLIVVFCLGLLTIAQDTDVRVKSNNSKNTIRVVTGHPKSERPQDANCSPGTISGFSNLPSSAATYTLTWTYTIFVTCGQPIVQTNASWLTPLDNQTTCSPNPAPLNVLIT